jgi:hypothetical protein
LNQRQQKNGRRRKNCSSTFLYIFFYHLVRVFSFIQSPAAGVGFITKFIAAVL